MEMSNKSLALLLVIALVISLGGTLMSLTKISEIRQVKPLPQKMVTGLASGAGKVEVTLGSLTACNVDTNVTFGTGNPTTTLILSTDKDLPPYPNASGFNNCSIAAAPCYPGMQINNTGNANINVSFSSDKNASALLGDSSPLASFTYDIRNGTFKAAAAIGCLSGLGTGGSIQSNTNYTVCQNLSFTNTADIASIGFNITINESTPKTSKQANIVVSCSTA